MMAVSASLLVAIPLWWMATRPEANVGTPPWAASDPSRGGVQSTDGVEASTIAVHSARLADLKPAVTASAPLRLGIPALGVSAEIVPVGVERTGSMEVPKDVATVGWYRFGPSPGSAGSSLLIGHVDSRLEGPGVFFGLSTLERGDEIRVRVSGGGWRSFEVVARNLVAKDRLPPGIFAREGDPFLTLVTCGGGFDEEAGHYTHNVVVSAVPRD
jgi:sortase (surface protein transpeptidase)